MSFGNERWIRNIGGKVEEAARDIYFMASHIFESKGIVYMQDQGFFRKSSIYFTIKKK